MSWNHFIKQQLGTGDYEGRVTLWDARLGTNIQDFVGHEKRVWSVDFSAVDPTRLSSGSDDGTVKIWDSGTSNEAVLTITPKRGGNVCSVKFSPQ